MRLLRYQVIIPCCIVVYYLISLKGFTVSPAMLNGLFLRFAKKRSFLNFDDFVSCVANLKLAVGM